LNINTFGMLLAGRACSCGKDNHRVICAGGFRLDFIKRYNLSEILRNAAYSYVGAACCKGSNPRPLQLVCGIIPKSAFYNTKGHRLTDISGFNDILLPDTGGAFLQLRKQELSGFIVRSVFQCQRT